MDFKIRDIFMVQDTKVLLLLLILLLLLLMLLLLPLFMARLPFETFAVSSSHLTMPQPFPSSHLKLVSRFVSMFRHLDHHLSFKCLTRLLMIPN